MVRRYGYHVLKWGFLLGVTLFFAWTIRGIFLPGSFMTSGNLHDVFIPYNAALYHLQGMVPHRDFHTPFGWLYGALNLLAWHVLVDRKVAGINELIPMASLLWLGLILALYALVMLALPARARPSFGRGWLLFLFVALVAFNFKGASGFSVRDLNWYGTYNNHLWAVLFVQIAGVFMVMGAPPSTRGVLVLAALNAVGVFLTCNYKITFGLSALALAAAPLVVPWAGRAWRVCYVGVGLALSVALTIALAPADYDFRLYMADLGTAAMAKAGNKGAIVGFWTWALAFAAIAVLAAKEAVDQAQAKAEALLPSGVMAARLLFASLVVGAVLVAVMGDYARPDFFLFACLAIHGLVRPWPLPDEFRARALKGGSLAVLFIGIVAYLASDARIAQFKRHPSTSDNYQAVVFDTPYGPLNWTIRKVSGFAPLSDLFRLDEHPKRLLVQSAITYRAHPYRDDVVIAFKNLDYVEATQAIRAWLAGRNGGDKQVVSVLDFINPVPMLMGRPIPKGSSHWLHFGTSIPVSGHDELVFGSIAASDVVVIPITSFDSNGQSLLNCRFHEWNRVQAHPFVPAGAGRFHIFYERSPQTPLDGLDEADIVRRCDILLRQFRSGAISPN